MEGDESGRAFLQTLADQPQVQTLAKSPWLDAFQSSRRLDLIAKVATNSYHHFERVVEDRDWLGAFPELKDSPVWAVDGHQIQHASHAIKDGNGRSRALGDDLRDVPGPRDWSAPYRATPEMASGLMNGRSTSETGASGSRRTHTEAYPFLSSIRSASKINSSCSRRSKSARWLSPARRIIRSRPFTASRRSIVTIRSI